MKDGRFEWWERAMLIAVAVFGVISIAFGFLTEGWSTWPEWLP